MSRLFRGSIPVLILISLFFILPSIIAVENDTFYTDKSSLKIESNLTEPPNEIVKGDIEYSILESNQFNRELEINEDKNLVQSREQLQDRYFDQIRYLENPDGITTAEIYLKPVFYRDKTGTQRFIDTDIIESETRKKSLNNFNDELNTEQYRYKSVKNNLKLFFKNEYSPDKDSTILLVKNKDSSYPITWQPIQLSVSSNTGSDNTINNNNDQKDNQINFQTSSGIITDNKIFYKNIYPGCDDEYVIIENELKHNFILNEFPSDLSNFKSIPLILEPDPVNELGTLDYYGILKLPPTLRPYLNNIPQHEPFETSELIGLYNKNTGAPIYCIEEPIAYEDARPNQQIRCSYEFIPIGDSPNIWTETIVILKTELNWLTTPDRQYPVIIDPDIITPRYDRGELGYDTYLVKGNETNPELSGHNFGNNRELKISLAGPSLYSKENLFYRSILRFPGVSAIPSHAQVLDAKLLLFLKEGNGEMSITVFRLFDDWIEGGGTDSEPSEVGASWNHSGYNIWLGGNYDGYNSTADTKTITTPTHYTWDITEIVKHWVMDDNTNQGVLLTGTDNEDVVKIFHSSEAIKEEVRPKLTVEYNTPPTLTGLDSLTIRESKIKKGLKVQTTKVNMSAEKNNGFEGIYYDPDPEKGEDILSFQIWNGSYIGKGVFERKVFVGSGVFSTENITVELRTDDKLYITPTDSEGFGEDTIYVRGRDRHTNLWLETTLMVSVIAVNDPPVITSIGEVMVIDNQVDLNAVEDEADDYTLVIYDPDNTDFFEEDTLKEDGAPGDLEFRWETEKTKRFTITQEKESASITFSPSNEHVGQFYMNVTVYDTYWEKPFTKLRKVERSNHTVMIIFTVENVNNPPGEPKIIEPKDSEFSAGENINFKGKCKDPDLLIPDSKERLTFIWSSDVDGELGSGKEIKSQLSKGKHVVNFTVIDSKKERSFKSFNITVRNRATISPVNCSHEFFDDEDDVLFYYYSLSDEGDKEYRIERGGDFPEYDIFIDILELTSVRDKNYLLINLTVNDDLSLHPESKSYKYRFSIYLVKPGHIEQVVNLKNMKYDSRFFDTLYSLDSSQYYAKFELEDGEITKDGRTLKIRKHLGDLEYGENINSELLSDFSIFATMKVELKQHPTDSFEHVICYDSIGLGSKSAPNPKKIESDGAPSSRDSELNLEFIASMLIIVIAIVVFIVIVIRKRKLEEKASEETLIDTTQAGMGLHMPVPPQPYGPFGTAPIGFPPPMLQPGPPGRPGVPMLPLLPPAPGQIHQPQFPGPGLMQPFSPMVGKGKKKKRSLKKSF